MRLSPLLEAKLDSPFGAWQALPRGFAEPGKILLPTPSFSFFSQVPTLFVFLFPLFWPSSDLPFLRALPRTPPFWSPQCQAPEGRRSSAPPPPPPRARLLPSPTPPPSAPAPLPGAVADAASPALFPILKTSSCFTNYHQRGVRAALTLLLPLRRRPRVGGF